MAARRLNMRRLISTARYSNMEKITLRFHSVPSEATSDLEVSDSPLTKDEMEFIDSTRFLQLLKISDKSKELDPKVTNISRFIPIQNGFLSYKRPANSPSPFEVLKLPNVAQITTSSESRIPVSDFPRLSVTKLLTDSWCELRDFYEVYSQATRDETIAMRRGKEIHHDLELTTHPLKDLSFIVESLPTAPTSAVDETAESVIDTITRLLNLFINGHAREIYIHTFLNETEGIVQGRDIEEEDILVTGIIDHLILQSSDKSDPLKHEMLSLNSQDIGTYIKQIKTSIEKHRSSYRLCVSDVKTRSRRTKPTQKSVLDASKKQVMIYEKMLRVFGSSELNGFKYLENYYTRRGDMDFDRPLTPEFALLILATQDIFEADLLKICQGVDIGVPEFDSMEHISSENYDLSAFDQMIDNEELETKLRPYLKVWKKPPTLRYFLIRLSQMFHEVSKLLTGDLRIEYYHKDELFDQIDFKYDENIVQETAIRALQFWSGARDPTPIEPTFQNISEKCRYCEFKNNCSWKFNFEKIHHL